MQRRMDEAFLRDARQQQQQQQPGVVIERSEQRSPGSYRYYEHIEVRIGPPMAALSPAYDATSPAAGGFSPLLAAAVALTAAWAAVTAALARRYDLTVFSERSRAQVLLAWPYLLAFSGRFREQFGAAMRGKKARAAAAGEAAAGEAGSAGVRGKAGGDGDGDGKGQH